MDCAVSVDCTGHPFFLADLEKGEKKCFAGLASASVESLIKTKRIQVKTVKSSARPTLLEMIQITAFGLSIIVLCASFAFSDSICRGDARLLNKGIKGAYECNWSEIWWGQSSLAFICFLITFSAMVPVLKKALDERQKSRYVFDPLELYDEMIHKKLVSSLPVVYCLIPRTDLGNKNFDLLSSALDADRQRADGSDVYGADLFILYFERSKRIRLCAFMLVLMLASYFLGANFYGKGPIRDILITFIAPYGLGMSLFEFALYAYSRVFLFSKRKMRL